MQHSSTMFDSPQLKRDLISSRIKFEYELSHELPNNLRYRISGKSQSWLKAEPSAQSPSQK